MKETENFKDGEIKKSKNVTIWKRSYQTSNSIAEQVKWSGCHIYNKKLNFSQIN